MNSFTHTFLTSLPPKARIADIGAGKGKASLLFAQHGIQVTAIEKAANDHLTHANISWHQFDAILWMQSLAKTDSFDAFFLRQLIQFIPKQDVIKILFPQLRQHTTKRGIVAISTFSKEPIPAFTRPLISLWSTTDIAKHFTDWQVLYENTYTEIGPSMDGKTREFFMTEIILKKS